MKIAKALKLKNRLAGEIARLKAIVQSHNSQQDGQEQPYDVATMVNTTLPQRVGELVLVKTAIACANSNIFYTNVSDYVKTPYWCIFKIAELKGLIQTLTATPSKNGIYKDGRGIARLGLAEPEPVCYVAAIKQGELDALVVKYQKEIDALQDDLDVSNASGRVDLLDTIEL